MNEQTESAPASGSELRISAALIQVRQRIRRAESDFGRSANSVTLLAVSKTKPVSAIREALAAGQAEFGENYLDEALEKQTALADDAPEGGNVLSCRWHYIGAIQSNKTSALARHFDWVHGVDRAKIARRLSGQRPPELPPLNCCIQVNIDNEPSKAGVLPGQLPELCAAMQDLPNIQLRGLMVIPAARNDFTGQRETFARVRRLFEQQQQDTPGLDTLSMGMSADIEAAIAEGATIVRMGTAIFGARTRP